MVLRTALTKNTNAFVRVEAKAVALLALSSVRSMSQTTNQLTSNCAMRSRRRLLAVTHVEVRVASSTATDLLLASLSV